MKRILVSLIAGALTATAGTAMASSGSLVQFKPKVMPVVVQVNEHGRITDVNPSMQLRPKLQQLLRKQLESWIVKPAEVKGHPVASEFIVEVALRATKDEDGNYSTSFAYVKSMPLPFTGPVAWAEINGGLELALIPANSVIPGIPGPRWTMQYDSRGYPTDSEVSQLAAYYRLNNQLSEFRHRRVDHRQVKPTSASNPVAASPSPRSPAPPPVQHFVPPISTGAPNTAPHYNSTPVPKVAPRINR